MRRRSRGVLADRDAEADLPRPADRDHLGRVEAGVGPDRQLTAGPGVSDPGDRLVQEVSGPTGGVGPAFAQAGHEHVARPGGDREQRVIAADVGIGVVPGTLLLEAVGLADRRVEIDRERFTARTGAGRPGPGEELAADPVELADVAPAEAAQERAHGRGGLDREAEDPLRAASPKRIHVVDAVAARERRQDEGQELVAGVALDRVSRPRSRCSSTSPPSPGAGPGWPAAGARRRPPVASRRRPSRHGRGCAKIASVRCSSGVGRWLSRNTIIPVQMGTCSAVPDRELGPGCRWIRG